MTNDAKEPATELDARYSSPGAKAVPWEQAEKELESALIYWISTVRPDGRPHAAPLIGIWLDNAFYFSTGAAERKARNLDRNKHCAIITGRNTMNGLDVILEGDAEQVSDEKLLGRLVSIYASKYGWKFTVEDGALKGDGGRAEVYRVAARKALGFAKGDVFSQTRWTF